MSKMSYCPSFPILGKSLIVVSIFAISFLILTLILTRASTADQEGREHNPMVSEIISDYDGNRYATVKINNRYWMAENLKALHYSDGLEIEGSYAYDNDEGHVEKFGRLYTWEALVKPNGICPQGWQVPTDTDWLELEKHLGMAPADLEDTGWRATNSEGIKLKKHETDFLWIKYSQRSVNQSGFSAIPAGVRTPKGKYMGLNKYADFWTRSEHDSEKAWNRSLVWIGIHPGKAQVYRNMSPKKWGFSVRCVRDTK